MKPLLKWAGGKRHIAAQLEASFPADWNSGTYIEPFIGGGAMFLHLNPETAVIADLNKRLVGFYKHVQSSLSDTFNLISEFSKVFNAKPLDAKGSIYSEFRNNFNDSEADSQESAALLYVLNKLCFNGLYRENSKGAFNVPFGQKKVFPPLVWEDFEEVSNLLRNVLILNSDFEKTVSRAQSGDFVYFDPPYIPLDVTSSFTSYHSEGFNAADQERLALTMVTLGKSGVRAMCSNSDTPLTREIYGELQIETIQAPRMVSAKASGRGTITELVIKNY